MVLIPYRGNPSIHSNDARKQNVEFLSSYDSRLDAMHLPSSHDQLVFNHHQIHQQHCEMRFGSAVPIAKAIAFPRGRRASPHAELPSIPQAWTSRSLQSSSRNLAPVPSASSSQLGSSSSTASPSNSNLGGAFNTVNDDEIAHFSRLSSQWWDEKGEFGLLHRMNPPRMQFVREKLQKGKQDDQGWSYKTRNDVGLGEGKASGKWLAGLDVLDVGCGGGLLTEVSAQSSSSDKFVQQPTACRARTLSCA